MGKKLTSQFFPQGKNGPAQFFPGKKLTRGKFWPVTPEPHIFFVLALFIVNPSPQEAQLKEDQQ